MTEIECSGHIMITGLESGSSLSGRKTPTRHAIEDGCPEFKKARHKWQVKNKTFTKERNDFLNTEDSCTTEIISTLDSLTPSCSHARIIIGSSSVQISEQEKCHSGFVHLNNATDVPALLPADGALISPTDVNPDCFGLNYSCNMNSKKNDSGLENITPEQHEKLNPRYGMQKRFPSSSTPEIQSHDFAEPLQHMTICGERSVPENSLMRAELDNDINKALECLRRLADQQSHHAYISNRISLETAGIFEVIEQKGLKTCGPNISSLDSLTLKTHQENFSSSFDQFLSSRDQDEDNSDMNTGITYHSLNIPENEDANSADKPRKNQNPESPSFLQYPKSMKLSSGDTCVVNLSTTPNSNFIIDQAVSAVICEKGIRL